MKKRIHLGEKKLKIYSSEIDFKEKGMNSLSEEPDEKNKESNNIKGNFGFFNNETLK